MTPDATPPEDALLALPAGDEFNAPPPPRRRGRGVLFAGVAGACVLGAGLGLWARPGMSERREALTPVVPAAPAGPARTLQVVVDQRPAPLGAPMQVLPTSDAKPAALMATPVFASAAPAPNPVVRAPVAPPPPTYRPPVQVAAVQPPAPQSVAPKPFSVARFAPLIAAAAAAPRMLITRLEAPKPPPILLAKADPPHRAQADRARAKAAAHKLALARAAEAKAAREEAAQEQAHETHLAELKAAQIKAAQARDAKARAAQVQLAKAEAAKAVKADHLAKLAQAQTTAKAKKAEEFRLAKAEAKGRAEARVEARSEALEVAKEEAQKQIRLASLVRTLKRVLPHEARPAPTPVRTAKLDRKHGQKAQRREAVIERASLKNRKAVHAVEAPVRAHAAPAVPPPRPSGLMKVSASRCGQRDPGEALVCADPNLGAADRQLARAYQGARAAGVPDAQLMRQQQRWLAARTAAAREAPWAVHDVYMARIAELNGLARDAHGDGYE